MLKEIKDDMFESEVLKADQTVIVEFCSPTCTPCKSVEKELKENIVNKVGDEVKVVKINVLQAPSSASAYSIMSVPTVISFKKGKITGHLVGQRKSVEYLNLLK
jgi:thioredoxin 1